MKNVAQDKSPAETPALQTAEAAWIAVVRAYNECTATLTVRLGPLGVSLLEHEILINLLRTPGLTQRQLSERCFSAKSGISMLIARMRKDALVDRKSLPQDARAWSIVLTPKGEALAQAVRAVQTEVVREMTAQATDAQLLLVRTLMDGSSERLRAMRTEDEI